MKIKIGLEDEIQVCSIFKLNRFVLLLSTIHDERYRNSQLLAFNVFVTDKNCMSICVGSHEVNLLVKLIASLYTLKLHLIKCYN